MADQGRWRYVVTCSALGWVAGYATAFIGPALGAPLWLTIIQSCVQGVAVVAGSRR